MLENKKIVITGIANKFSIANGIAKAMSKNGAELAFLYQNERLLKRIKPIAEELGVETLVECDVSSDDSIDKAFLEIKKKWGKVCLLYTSPSPRDRQKSRMPSSA